MERSIQDAIAAQMLALADDQMILAHRNSEWTGHAPILEEDIAFTNIALDEMGHAAIWYGQLAQLLDEDPDRYPDRLVFFRSADDYRNVQMVELPGGDWAFSMMRQYLFDVAELVRLGSLGSSRFRLLAEASAKILREELYHHRHTAAWVQRLGMGTEESNMRAQAALDALYPLALQLFQPLEGEGSLQSRGYVPDAGSMLQDWRSRLSAHLASSGLRIPDRATAAVTSRTEHTEHMSSLLAEMQVVARSEVEADW